MSYQNTKKNNIDSEKITVRKQENYVVIKLLILSLQNCVGFLHLKKKQIHHYCRMILIRIIYKYILLQIKINNVY